MGMGDRSSRRRHALPPIPGLRRTNPCRQSWIAVAGAMDALWVFSTTMSRCERSDRMAPAGMASDGGAGITSRLVAGCRPASGWVSTPLPLPPSRTRPRDRQSGPRPRAQPVLAAAGPQFPVRLPDGEVIARFLHRFGVEQEGPALNDALPKQPGQGWAPERHLETRHLTARRCRP